MKVLCILLPHFPLGCEIHRHPELEGRLTLVTRTEGSWKTVLDFSLELDGLQPGMPLQEALSRHSEVELIPGDMPCYWSEFNRILDALEMKSPLVEGSDLGCAYIGLDGMEWVYRNDEELILAIREAIPSHFPVQLGLAIGKFLSYLGALNSPLGGCSVVAGDAGAFLKDFPCDVLPISWKDKKKLCAFGLRTLGQVAALPLGPLQSQFGPEGRRIRDLARGQDESPLYPRSSEEAVEENMCLPSLSTSLDVLLVAVESLLSRAFSRKCLRDKGVRSVSLWVRTPGAGCWERRIAFKEPATDAGRALSRIKHVLARETLPGPVEELGIRLGGLCHESGHQKSLFTDIRARDQLEKDIKEMEFRLGSPQVFRIKEVEPWSRIPERRQALTPSGR
ncbi:MAG: hypothetical protein HYX87_04610 [Chloroflexi bacterium]|nr:hypothetical protein [Chloroflexota bacterium]